jgi:hypothetical protein
MPFWRKIGLMVSVLLCVWTLAGMTGGFYACLSGLVFSFVLLVGLVAEHVFGSASEEAELPEPTEDAADHIVSEEWDETFSTLRDQAESVGLSLNDALGGPEPVTDEEGELSLEERVSQLSEAVNAEKGQRDAAIRKALVLERDIWNRTFAKTFTARVNEVLRHVRGDRDEAVSTAIAGERKAWRDALEAKTQELRETFESQGQALLRQAEELVAQVREETSAGAKTKKKGRGKKPRAKKAGSTRTGGTRKSKQKSR